MACSKGAACVSGIASLRGGGGGEGNGIAGRDGEWEGVALQEGGGEPKQGAARPEGRGEGSTGDREHFDLQEGGKIAVGMNCWRLGIKVMDRPQIKVWRDRNG